MTSRSRSATKAVQSAPASKRTRVATDSTTKIGTLATKLISIEDAAPWSAVKSSFSYKQKAWLSHVIAVRDEADEADEVAALSRLKSLLNDLVGAFKPCGLAPWFAPSAQLWSHRMGDATDAAALAPVIEALAAAVEGGDAPAWLSVPKIELGDEPALNAETEGARRGGKRVKREEAPAPAEPRVKMEIDAAPDPACVTRPHTLSLCSVFALPLWPF